jgi:hypothetical protein
MSKMRVASVTIKARARQTDCLDTNGPRRSAARQRVECLIPAQCKRIPSKDWARAGRTLSSICHHEPSKQPVMGRYEPVPDEA